MILSFLYVEQYWKKKICHEMFCWVIDMLPCKENSGEIPLQTHKNGYNWGNIGVHGETRKFRHTGQAQAMKKGRTGVSKWGERTDWETKRVIGTHEKQFTSMYLFILWYLEA